ncbi:unnamed protein product [Caenorhabditis brenneri]
MSDCPLCCKLFTTSGTNAPRVLSCGHSICDGCVDKQNIDEQVKCIKCEHVSKIIDGIKFPLNHSLIEMIDAPNCVFHTDNWKVRQAKYFCNTCGSVTCLDCSNSNVHFGHSVNFLASVAESHRARLRKRGVLMRSELRDVSDYYGIEEEIKNEIYENQVANEKRLIIALKEVLLYENIDWTSERQEELLSLIRGYRRKVESKLQMLSEGVDSCRKAVSTLDDLEKMTDAELVFQERSIAQLETFKFDYDVEDLPYTELGDFYPAIINGKMHLWEMEYAECFDCQFSTTNRFISFFDTQFNVFPLSPNKFIVYTHGSIVQISFKTGDLPMPHSTGMYLTMNKNMGQVYLFKRKGSWGITEVYSSEKLVVPNEDVKLYEECGKDDYNAFSKFLEITHKMSRVMHNPIYMAYPPVRKFNSCVTSLNRHMSY